MAMSLGYHDLTWPKPQNHSNEHSSAYSGLRILYLSGGHVYPSQVSGSAWPHKKHEESQEFAEM